MSIHFAAFELDEQNYELRRHGNRVRVPRRVFDTIAFLAANANRVVSKQELIDGPWRGQSVTDAALARVIMRAREALDDDAANPTLITTVRGRGFRFHLAPGGLPEDAGPQRQPALRRNVFVGRSKELERLSRAWADARDGKGGLMLVTGEPGIGKSALVERFSSLIGGKAAVLQGKAWEAGGSPPFWIWSEALGEFCDSREPSQLRAFAGANASDLARIAPQLREALLDLAGSAPSEDDSLETRFRVFDSVASFLREAAMSDPLLVVLEDLHSVDDAALSLLGFVTERISRSRILIVATCRTPELTRRATISALAVGSNTLQVDLTGLSESEIAEWLEHRPPLGLPRPNPAEIHSATTGHPFLVRDALESRSEQLSPDRGQRLHARNGGVPEHLAQSVRRRLSRLEPQTRVLLERACVVGREFSISQLRTPGESDPDRQLNYLAPALREGLIEQAVCAGGRLQFHHELVRRTLYGDLPLARRMELHQSHAERLIQAADGHDSALEIANHLLISAPQYGVAKAVSWTLTAYSGRT